MADLNNVTILVVEDSWHIANVLKYVLQDMGAIVLGPVGAVKEALEVIKNRRPELVLVDYNLRCNESSAPLIEFLIQSKIKFIVLTGYDDVADFPEHDFPILGKPLNTAKLLSELVALYSDTTSKQ